MQAEPLSPIDAATLWPQMHRLGTEVIATRAGENLLVSSGLAATGLTRLPRVPRTAVLGLKRGLGYRGVLVARELAGGAGWEVVSLRMAREKDDEAVTSLLSSIGVEVARRGGRSLYLRYPEGSPHRDAIRKGGLMPYRLEQLHAIPASTAPAETIFRPARRRDRHGVFRLYCRVVPEHIRRQEAPTQQDWRSVHDSYDCVREFVFEHEGAVAAWVGLGDRECRVLVDSSVEGLTDAALHVVETHAPRHGTLVLGEDQTTLEHEVAARGYLALGVRVLCARRLALMNPLKEVVAVPAGSAVLPQ
ncbi:MAG: hypothetical protein M0R74_12865 [Dehalococcoidia bacterium]|nr:hypothetical protein [Dehalococcoidia bacterium]